MTTLGIELSDAGLVAATAASTGEPEILPEPEGRGAAWPGFAYHDGSKYRFGREAENAWFTHPRQVCNNFLTKLTHEPATISLATRPPSFSELAFYFLREYIAGLSRTGVQWDKVVLAVPGFYLKDEASEEEKVGLLLGIAGELNLPLAGIMDLACASICDTRGPGFNPALPIVMVDVSLHGTDLSILTAERRFARREFLQLPLSGSLQLLKHLTSTMGNRFLRHTAFDILADGQIERTFFRQTEEFVITGADEYRFQINTAKRAYDLLVKSDQLTIDSQAFVTGISRALQSFIHSAGFAPETMTAVLTDRSAVVPGLREKLQEDGFRRIVKLPAGAGAWGAARAGVTRMSVPEDLADIAVETAVPIHDAHRMIAMPWQARLRKVHTRGPRPAPTHAIIDGIGYAIGDNGRFTIGSQFAGAKVALPDEFNAPENCLVALMRDDGKLWYVDPAAAEERGSDPDDPMRAPVEAGDRLVIRSGEASVEILFAHCPALHAARGKGE